MITPNQPTISVLFTPPKPGAFFGYYAYTIQIEFITNTGRDQTIFSGPANKVKIPVQLTNAFSYFVDMSEYRWSLVHKNTKYSDVVDVRISLRGSHSPTANTNIIIHQYYDTLVYSSENAQPTMNGITLTEKNMLVSTVAPSTYLRGLSEIEVGIPQGNFAYFAEVAGYEYEIGGVVIPSIRPNYLFRLTQPGYNVEVKARIQDTRRIWSEWTRVLIPVKNYSPPVISGYQILRSSSAGVEDQLGVYAKHTANLSVMSVIDSGEEVNKIQYGIDKMVGSNSVSVVPLTNISSLTSNISKVVGTYSIDSATSFRITLYDAFGGKDVKYVTMTAARVPFSMSKRGSAVGGLFVENDPANLQVYGSINVKEGGQYLLDGMPLNAGGASNLALGTTSTTAHRGDHGNTAYTHSQATHAPTNAQANQTITSGNGMAAWTATSGDLTVSLGTPSTVTNATTNSVTSTSHTHALTLTKADITGLGIPAQDTVYTHPASHPAAMIVPNTNRQFVTDAEKAAWNDGSIIERGSNDKGTYLKFGNGEMICYGTNTFVTPASMVDGGIYRHSTGDYRTNNFPVTFYSKPSVDMMVHIGEAWCSLRTISTTNFTWRYYSYTAWKAGATKEFFWKAHGRWKA